MRTTALIALAAALAAAKEFVPARRIDGQLPLLPGPQVVGWLEEAVDLALDENGIPEMTRLRGNTPGSKFLDPALATWRFQRALEDGKAVRSHVLVYSVVRPPQLFDQPTIGAAPADLAPAPDEIAYPAATRRPRYPPRAKGSGLVLVEVLVDVDGRVRSADVVGGSRGFDEEALISAREWVFRPARRAGLPVRAWAYLLFGFREPIAPK